VKPTFTLLFTRSGWRILTAPARQVIRVNSSHRRAAGREGQQPFLTAARCPEESSSSSRQPRL